MTMAQRIADKLEAVLRSGGSGGWEEGFLLLGDDSPMRAQLAYEILCKARNYSQLVRVQRTVSKNGKSYVTHVWVKPDKVKKNDVVVAGRDALNEWRKQHDHQDDAQEQKTVPGWNGNLNEMSGETMRELHTEAVAGKGRFNRALNMSSIADTMDHVYLQYGYKAAVAYATAYAKETFEYDEWTEEFSGTETQYAPELLAMVRYEWTDKDYESIRDSEKTALSDDLLTGATYYKMCNDILNDMIETDSGKAPAILYRGLAPKNGRLDEFEDAEIGGTITLGAVSSFSGDEQVANRFIETEGGLADGVILKLETDASLKSLYVAGMENVEEDEYIVRDGAYQVVDKVVEDEDWGHVVELTLRLVSEDAQEE